MGIIFLVYIVFGLILAGMVFHFGSVSGPTITKYPNLGPAVIFFIIVVAWLPCLFFAKYKDGDNIKIDLHI
jgi:hypothetical protein